MVNNINETLPFQLLDNTIGIEIDIISNDFQETPGGDDSTPNTYQEIVFQIKEEEPDLSAMGVLYALSLMSFSYAAPRGVTLPNISSRMNSGVSGILYRAWSSEIVFCAFLPIMFPGRA